MEKYSHRKNISSNQPIVISLVKTLLSQNFCQKRVRENFLFFHTVRWKSRNFTATVFTQNFRQINNFTVNWFDVKNFVWQWIFRFSTLHSVEICKFFPHDILQKFRQINFFTKELYCKSIWRKNFAVGENFWNYHTVFYKKILWNQFRQKSMHRLISRIIFKMIVKFNILRTVCISVLLFFS